MAVPKRVLLICGSPNQTTQMHQVGRALGEHDCRYTPFYGDALVTCLRNLGLAEGTIVGHRFRQICLDYLAQHQLPVDLDGAGAPYDLVVTCQDVEVPRNIRPSPIVLVQEGMVDPENWASPWLRRMRFLPRWVSSTTMTGLSHLYARFCVASEGFRDEFARRGVDPSKLVVTGMPNFDHCDKARDNDFPHRGYVLVCTTDMRETFRWENRRKTIAEARQIAGDRPLIFKLHPNEKVKRAVREIRRWAPGALVYNEGPVDQMIANCDVLVTQYSSTAFVGLALGKEVHSWFDADDLRRLTPLQNGGRSAHHIANVCRELLNEPPRPPLAQPIRAPAERAA